MSFVYTRASSFVCSFSFICLLSFLFTSFIFVSCLFLSSSSSCSRFLRSFFSSFLALFSSSFSLVLAASALSSFAFADVLGIACLRFGFVISSGCFICVCFSFFLRALALFSLFLIILSLLPRLFLRVCRPFLSSFPFCRSPLDSFASRFVRLSIRSLLDSFASRSIRLSIRSPLDPFVSRFVRLSIRSPLDCIGWCLLMLVSLFVYFSLCSFRSRVSSWLFVYLLSGNFSARCSLLQHTLF